MQEVNLFEIFTLPLINAEIKFCITGSVAAMVYGQPRLTHDIDIVVELAVKDILLLPDIFPQEHFYLPPKEIIYIESSRERRGHFNIIHLDSGYKADFYISGEDPLHQWAFNHLSNFDISGHIFPLAPPEYVIIRKLQFYKEGCSQKHLGDIRAILSNPEVKLNFNELDRWAKLSYVENEWKMILDSSLSK